MIGTRFLAVAAYLACGMCWAASTAELDAAFAKARKKGATAMYHERCHGDRTSTGGLFFQENSTLGLVKAMGALAAMAAIKDQSGNEGCSAGLQPGQERYYEIYPDGSVKARD